MSKKDLLTTVIIPLVCALISGLLVWFLTPDWEVQAKNHGWVDTAQWHDMARDQEWLPLVECPTIPMRVELTSPGTQSIIPLDLLGDRLLIRNAVVVVVSKSPATHRSIGLIFKPEMDTNYYVDFPLFESYDSTHFKTDFIELPFAVEGEIKVDVWAFYVDDPASVGDLYTSISQFESSGFVLLSEPVSWTLRH
jgi:hypothetical protein